MTEPKAISEQENVQVTYKIPKTRRVWQSFWLLDFPFMGKATDFQDTEPAPMLLVPILLTFSLIMLTSMMLVNVILSLIGLVERFIQLSLKWVNMNEQG